MGFCSISPNQKHEHKNGTCLHFHQSGEDSGNQRNSHSDNHHEKKDKHDSAKIHCHISQIIVCLNNFIVFISTFNYEPFVENPITSFISYISIRIDHIPICLF